MRRATAALLAVAAVLFAIRATAPANFLDKDQERPASYILDAVVHGHWLCQTDWSGDITSKPPLLTWIGAALAKVAGGVSPLTLYLPSALALTLLAWITLRVGAPVFGGWAALFGGLIVLLSPIALRQFILLRTDALFACTVGLSAFAAWRAWRLGRGWWLFGVAAGAATLTKGPFGIVLGASGLLAALWMRADGPPSDSGFRFRPAGLLLGALLALGMAGAWFALAYGVYGEPVIDKMIRRELVAHAVDIGDTSPLYLRVFKPTLYFLHRVLPWSIPAAVGLWRTVVRPAADETERRFERFLFCWFVFGVGVLSVVQHQRSDLLSPMLAPAALLAGRELARWARAFSARRVGWGAAVLCAVSLGHAAYYYHVGEARTGWVRDTVEWQRLAGRLRAADVRPSVFVDVPYTLQLYLGCKEPIVNARQAAAAWPPAEKAVLAVTPQALEALRRELGARAPAFVERDRSSPDQPLAVIVTIDETTRPVRNP